MLRKLVSALARSGELSGYVGSSVVIRLTRSQSSIRVRRISSFIVSTRIVSSIVFRPRQSRPSGGGPCAGGGGCIACDGNGEDERFSACAHQADDRRDKAGRRTGLVWTGWRKRSACRSRLRRGNRNSLCRQANWLQDHPRRPQGPERMSADAA